MSDLISRQAALDALGEAPEVWMDTPEEFAELNQWEYDVAAIKAVPSETCDDCIRHVCNYNNVDWDGKNDYISRQDAVDAINALHEKPNAWLDSAVDAMMTLPSAQPKTGRWIRWKAQDKADLDNGNALYECSNCGHTDLHAETQEVPYCWYCGADMRGEQDE